MTPYRFLRAAASGILALALSSCIFPFETDFAEQTGDLPLVVEGDILIGGATTIQLRRVQPFKELEDEERERYAFRHVTATIEGEDGAKVTDTYDGGYIFYGYSRSSMTATLYFDTRDLRPDQRYRLVLSVQGPDEASSATYESDWVSVTPAPVIDGLTYSANTQDGTLQWKWKVEKGSTHYSPAAVWPVEAAGKVFVTDPDRAMSAIDAQT